MAYQACEKGVRGGTRGVRKDQGRHMRRARGGHGGHTRHAQGPGRHTRRASARGTGAAHETCTGRGVIEAAREVCWEEPGRECVCVGVGAGGHKREL